MRLDHLLSKEERVRVVLLSSPYEGQKRIRKFDCTKGATNKFRTKLAAGCLLSTQTFGGDADRGNTRTHPEHDG